MTPVGASVQGTDPCNAYEGGGPMFERIGRASLKSLALLIAAAPLFSLPQPAAAETWRINGLSPDARLHVREEADADSDVVGYVPGNARGLTSRVCVGNWCEITYQGLRGWVYKPYLAPDTATAAARPAVTAQPGVPAADVMTTLSNAKRLPVIATDGRPIPIFAFPDDKLPIAGMLSPDVREVQGLGSCMRTWCYVRSGGLIGWMHVSLFDVDAIGAPEATGAIAEAAEPAPQAPAAPVEEAAPAVTAAPAEEDKALNKTETTASNIAIGGNAAALPKVITGGDGGKLYSLAGLGSGASLPIFDKPDGNAPILGWIPREARNIEGLRKCQDRWCMVRWESTSGWVARRHLADENSGGQVYQVTGLSLWSPLKVLDEPADDAQEVGTIPSYATGIVPIGVCNTYWCHVRYLGVAGWVTTRNLQPYRP